MQPERWRQIEQLFHSALKVEESRRAAFLEEACAGDEGLRLKLESLLAHHEEAGSFLESPLWKDADPDLPILKQAKAEYARLQ